MTITEINKPDHILEVKGLWKIYGSKTDGLDLIEPDAAEALRDQGAVLAVNDVSFKVKRGQVFVIMGLSGSGKSTLIRCIPRLVEPSQGELIVNGRNVTELNDLELTEFRRKDIAMVFQHYGLLPHRNVLENVCFGLKLRGMSVKERQDRARKVLSRVGLEGWEHHYPAQLSGGMRQRVGIARALVQESDILLMDEPFSGLDPLIRREMQDMLVWLQEEEHKTIIFVTHDLNEAAHLGDRMAVMKNGKFVQEGTPQEVIAHPADEYVERFVSDQRQMMAGSRVKPLVSIPAMPRKDMPAAAGSEAPIAGIARRR